jgi:hypothetical protein
VFTMSKMFASYSVDDISAARQFYDELGLQVTAASNDMDPCGSASAEIKTSCCTPKPTTCQPRTRSSISQWGT